MNDDGLDEASRLNNRLIEKTKLSAVSWQEAAARAYQDGNQIKQARCYEYMAADMAFLTLLENEIEAPTVPYVRYENNTFISMHPIGPHQAVQKVYHDRNLAKSIARYPTDDNKKLPSSETG